MDRKQAPIDKVGNLLCRYDTTHFLNDQFISISDLCPISHIQDQETMLKISFVSAASMVFLLALGLASCSSEEESKGDQRPEADMLLLDEERQYLSNLRQLTFGGENAEGYFSFDESRFIFQRTLPEEGDSCDQIYIYDLSSGRTHRVSTGYGRTTCSYFLPGDSMILYASTHLADSACPPPPDYSKGYVWSLYPGYDIFVADTTGTILSRLTQTNGYDAEATVSPSGDRIVFTSTRTGDLELFSMNLDGSDVKQLTNEQGYDGGAFYCWNGKEIVFRASRPEGETLKGYQALLKENMIRPGKLEIYVMNADGSDVRQVTENGKANFGPFWHPDGEHIIFSSNMDDPKGREFDLYMIRKDGTGLKRITYSPEFDGFPMFTRDAKRLIFASNRNNSKRGETNLFICDFSLGE